MKNLLEISKIVTKKKVKKIEIFDEGTLKHKNSKFNEFYEYLNGGKLKNDRDAASLLYNCSPTDAKYRQLKSRFKKRLLNTLFFLNVNTPASSNYDRAHFSCNKDWSLIKILISNDAQHTAATLAKQTLNLALKFRFADIIINCSRILREYAANIGDMKAYEIYDTHIKQYSDVLDAEIRSEEFYQRVQLNLSLSRHNSNIEERISSYCDALVSLSELYDSPVIFYNMFLVWVLRYEIQNQYELILEVCNQAENYIDANPNFFQEDKVVTFHIKKMSAFLHLREYKKGKANAEKSLNIIPEGNLQWFDFMEYYLLLAIHTDQFIQALAIFNKVHANNNFRKLDGSNKEKWAIYEAYINYILESQGIESSFLFKKKRSPFKISKFLNDKVIYQKEQRNFTTLLLILQILFLLERKTLSGVSDRVERLKSLANRQLKKEESFRAIQFIRLLQQLRKVEYQIEELSNTEKYYNRLLQVPFTYRGLNAELEVIPYEKLWERILTYFK